MDQFYSATLTVSVLLMSIIWCVMTLLKPAGKTPPLPPGPRGLPIVGYLPFIGNNLLYQFTDLGHQYGPIYKLHLGNKLCVVNSSPSLVKEVVRDQDGVFAYRDTPVAGLVATYRGNDIALSQPNSQWRLMRKILIQEVLSNRSLDASYSLREDEVRKIIRHVYAKMGKPIEIGALSFRTELNVIMNMLWGGTVEGEEGERIAADFRLLISKIIYLFGKPNISDFYPFLARLDIQGVKKDMERYVQSADRIFDTVIAEYKKKLSAEIKKEGKKDFLQILLELKEKEDSDISISERQIKAILLDIVAGATDTTATTIEWAMAELMNNPEVMAQAQKELSDVVGMGNNVEEFHMPKLKYLEAVLKETMRLHPAVPLLVPRSPAQSSAVGGYTISKNTRVFINVWLIQRDPSIWDNPMEFKPERFLDDNGKLDFRGNHFHYLPFGSGKRICAGMALAGMLIYLLASLLHSFDWKLPEGETFDMSETFGIVLRKSTPLVVIPNPRLPESNLYP
ncbi:hypothetical protein Pfo_010242 [Paulownia fortunei]|nr:hypothetical protein Pfo_010242 [Paulownia fortunei]